MKKKNEGAKGTARNLIALLLVIFAIVIGGSVIMDLMNEKGLSSPTSHHSSTSSSKSSSTSSSVESSTSSSSSSESSASSSTTVSSSYAHWSNIDDDGAEKYQAYYVEQLNNTLYASGSNDRVSGGYACKEFLTVVVPQEYKYYSDNELQQLVDSLLNLKNSFFGDWAKENHYYSDSDIPRLYVSTPDGATIAKESIWDNTMKLK